MPGLCTLRWLCSLFRPPRTAPTSTPTPAYPVSANATPRVVLPATMSTPAVPIAAVFRRQSVTPRRVNSGKPRGIKEKTNSVLDLALEVPAPPCRSLSLSEPVNDAVIHQLSTMQMLRDADCSAGACMRRPSARLFTRHATSANQQNPQSSCHAAVSLCLHY